MSDLLARIRHYLEAQRLQVMPDAGEKVAHCGPIVTKDRKSTRLKSSHLGISYAVFCLKKKNQPLRPTLDASRPPHRLRYSRPDPVTPAPCLTPATRMHCLALSHVLTGYTTLFNSTHYG